MDGQQDPAQGAPRAPIYATLSRPAQAKQPPPQQHVPNYRAHMRAEAGQRAPLYATAHHNHHSPSAQLQQEAKRLRIDHPVEGSSRQAAPTPANEPSTQPTPIYAAPTAPPGYGMPYPWAPPQFAPAGYGGMQYQWMPVPMQHPQQAIPVPGGFFYPSVAPPAGTSADGQQPATSQALPPGYTFAPVQVPVAGQPQVPHYGAPSTAAQQVLSPPAAASQVQQVPTPAAPPPQLQQAQALAAVQTPQLLQVSLPAQPQGRAPSGGGAPPKQEPVRIEPSPHEQRERWEQQQPNHSQAPRPPSAQYAPPPPPPPGAPGQQLPPSRAPVYASSGGRSVLPPPGQMQFHPGQPYGQQYGQPYGQQPYAGSQRPHPVLSQPGWQQQQPSAPRDSARITAVNINKRITSAQTAQDILNVVQFESGGFDSVCIATAVHRLASLRGAPNLHEVITQSPEFFKLVKLVEARCSELVCRNIANVLWGFAKMNYLPPDELMRKLCDELTRKATQGNAQNLANSLWAISSLQYDPGEATLNAVAAAIKTKTWEFNSQNISNTVLAFAKLEHKIDPEVLDLLGREALKKLPTFTSQALSNTLWGLSKLGIGDGELFQAVGQGALHALQEFAAQNLANAIWAYGNLGINPGEEVLDAYARQCIYKINEFTPQNLSNVVWAFAKLSVWHPDLFATAADKAVETMHAFTPQSTANFLWSYATLGMPPPSAFMQAAVAHALPKLQSWAPQNLSNAAWALAVMREEEVVKPTLGIMIPAITREVTERLNDPEREASFSRQHLANLVWSLAVTEYHPGELTLRSIAEALKHRVDMCIPQELANTVYACSRLQYYDGPLMDAFALEATARMGEFTQQNLSNIAWAYAKLSHFSAELFEAIAAVAISQVDEMNDQHISNLLWSVATLNVESPELIAVLRDQVLYRLNTVGIPQMQIIPTMWSLAVAGALTRQFWDACVEALAAGGTPYNELQPEALTQVFQAWMLAGARQREVKWPVDPALLSLGRTSWLAATQNVTISEFHSEVSRTLRAMGVPHALEHLTEDGLFSIDIALPEEKIAIEVDGPHHFTRNTLRPMGDMFGRTALLEARGWRVASVPFFAWFGAEDAERREFLSNLIQRARAGDKQAHPTYDAPAAGQRARHEPPSLARPPSRNSAPTPTSTPAAQGNNSGIAAAPASNPERMAAELAQELAAAAAAPGGSEGGQQ